MAWDGMQRAIGNKCRGEPLNDKERAVMKLYAEGRTQQQVIAALGLTHMAVWYRANCAAKKLGATTLQEAAIKYAVAVATGKLP